MDSTQPLPIPPSVHQSSAPLAKPRGWWSRNWMWFVPTGCFSLLVLFAIFVAGIVVIVFGALKSTDVYKTAVARAKANIEVRAALGDDVHPGILLSGNTNVSGGSGQADLSIPISGSKGKGTIYVVATKSAGEWNYSQLVVKTEGGETIDLAAPEKKDEL
ncbi:MAG: cytochrome c oxidase assembly factor 1 family protein [Chthoniobacterales bacterium]